MENITVAHIVEAAKGRLTAGNGDTPITHISIDSRKMKGDDLFVPIVGERNDAHDFINMAFENGAKAVIYSRDMQVNDKGAWIKVADTKAALQAIGTYYRSRLTLPVVGITGSVGKTTTRELVAAALSPAMTVFKTEGNLNSQVGVPVSVAEISFRHEAAVLELGMSEFGEMERIAAVAKPDIAVFTNIGVTHIEQLGTRENILKEKWHLTDYIKPGGKVIVNGDDDLLARLDKSTGFQIITYGFGEKCRYRATHISVEDGGTVFTAEGFPEPVRVSLHVLGDHMILNALAALAVAYELGVPLHEAAKGLKTYKGFKGRQQIYQVGTMTVIDDSYNASPVSMKAALGVLASLPAAGRKIAVLANMNELGAETKTLHYDVGVYAGSQPIQEVVVIGDLAENIARGVGNTSGTVLARSFKNNDQAAKYLNHTLRAFDTVLFKGSNSTNLGEIISLIEKR